MVLKIATWNLCLGLINKKFQVKQTLLAEQIDVCCMQETEIKDNYPVELLTFPGYTIEVESNDVKSRVGFYINDQIKFTRRKDLEGMNSNLIIIDIIQNKPVRLINIYRSFRPQDNVTPREKFKYQLGLVKNAMNLSTILVGDFNIDYNKKFDVNYVHKNLFADFDETLSNFGLAQLINFPTWSRLVENTLKSSILDHLYSTDCTQISNINSIKPTFGDHMLVSFEIKLSKNPPINCIKRDWRKYSKENLSSALSMLDWNINIENVQEYWNVFENMLIDVVDEIVPLTDFVNNVAKNTKPPKEVNNMLNVRKRYLKQFRSNPSQALKLKIGTLDKSIRLFFRSEKCKFVRKGIIPGNSKTLWRAVSIAKDINIAADVPDSLSLHGVPVQQDNLADTFANFFNDKVLGFSNETVVCDNVYNGQTKVHCDDKMFMSSQKITECVKSIKIKNSEGYDRIPQRILADGIDHLVMPLSHLFSLIYYHNEIPSQWLIAKVCPIFKKGNKNEISNYRPISNLCSTSKIFEKLILKRILEIQEESKIDLTGVEQHGFKAQKSTASAGLIIQSIIARAVDSDNFALMASIDLSAAFDLVNIELLMKRLTIIGLPKDILRLIKLWLSKRSFFVNINGKNSMVIDLKCGTIQGSILGPILYAIYVSPLFDLLKLTNFADDNFVIRWSNCMTALISNMEKDLEIMTKWLKDSGLKVNESKTELCLFHRKDCPQITIRLNQNTISSSTSMNVLGITFDSKLQWSKQVANVVKKSTKALHAIRLIRPYFSFSELRSLITSNFYSILYYNSEVWHLPTLNPVSKNHLLAASANALKLCTPNYDRTMSFETLHVLNGRANPTNLMKYKHAILLYKIYNRGEPPKDWLALNFNQVLPRRQTYFAAIKDQNFKIGSNILSNRLTTLNHKIPLQWLNLSIDTFKVKCKTLFL
jgi:hypothetical protein